MQEISKCVDIVKLFFYKSITSPGNALYIVHACVCLFVLEDTPEYNQLLRAHELSRDLLHFVNEEVREQENWRKTLNIKSRLDKRQIEQSKHPVILELMVG